MFNQLVSELVRLNAYGLCETTQSITAVVRTRSVGHQRGKEEARALHTLAPAVTAAVGVAWPAAAAAKG